MGNIKDIQSLMEIFAGELTPVTNSLDGSLKRRLTLCPDSSCFAMWIAINPSAPNDIIVNQCKASPKHFKKEMAKHRDVAKKLGFQTLENSLCWVAIENSGTDIAVMKQDDSFNDTLFSLL